MVAKSTLMPSARTKPSPRPTVDPMNPMTSASKSTERLTCRRLAPRARNRASSRLRWATRIEKVLMIRKAPTTSETPAKTSRNVLMNDSALLMSLAAWSAALSPVSASTPAGRTDWTRSRSSAWLTPSLAVTEMSV